MRHLLLLCFGFAACATPPVETSDTSQALTRGEETIVVVGTAPPDCGELGNYENVYNSEGRWTGCRCFAFCSGPITDPGFGGDGHGGGGGGGGGDDADDPRRQRMRSCLNSCDSSTSHTEETCLHSGGPTYYGCMYAIDDRCLGVRQLCHNYFFRPDGVPLPKLCRQNPATLECRQAFEQCESAWLYGNADLADEFRFSCSFAAKLETMDCKRDCLALGTGMKCDVMIGGQTDTDDGHLDDSGGCVDSEGGVTDCANDDVTCQYGAEAND